MMKCGSRKGGLQVPMRRSRPFGNWRGMAFYNDRQPNRKKLDGVYSFFQHFLRHLLQKKKKEKNQKVSHTLLHPLHTKNELQGSLKATVFRTSLITFLWTIKRKEPVFTGSHTFIGGSTMGLPFKKKGSRPRLTSLAPRWTTATERPGITVFDSLQNSFAKQERRDALKPCTLAFPLLHSTCCSLGEKTSCHPVSRVLFFPSTKRWE